LKFLNSIVTVQAARAAWLAWADLATTCCALAATLPCLSLGPAASSPLSPSPFPICRQEPSQAVRRFFVIQQAIATMLLSSSFLKLLCPPLPAMAGPQPATAALTRRASPFPGPSPVGRSS